MSVAAMADNRLLRSTPREVPQGAPGVEVPDRGRIPGVKEGTLNAIVQWIPVETIGAYLFLQQLFLDPLSPGPGEQLHELDFGARWRVFFVGLALTVISIPLYTAVKAKVATADFKLPLAETLLGAIAFCLWAAAIADSPASDWDWWTPDFGVAAVTVSVLLLNPIAVLLNLKAQWGKTPEA